MDKDTQRMFLIGSVILSFTIIVGALLLAGGLNSFIMTRAHLAFLIATVVVQICTLMYVIIGTNEDNS